MQPVEVFRLVKAIDIEPVLAVLPQLRFVSVNVGSINPRKAPCMAVPPAERLPEAVYSFVDGLGLGGVTKRLLFRKLLPRQGMAPHVDEWMGDEADWRRFQVPLTSDPAIRMRWPDDGVELYLEPGSLYEVRFDRLHEVVNEADVERVHLQVDQVNATV